MSTHLIKVSLYEGKKKCSDPFIFLFYLKESDLAITNTVTSHVVIVIASAIFQITLCEMCDLIKRKKVIT